MIKRILRKTAEHFLILFLGAVLGLAALLLVYCLPVEPMRVHVWNSLSMIEQEFKDTGVIEGYPATLTGNFTDCLMLEHAVYENEEHSLLSRVLYIYRGESSVSEGWIDGWAPGYSLKDYLEFIPQPREVQYARYWHGYLVILKPLLLLTSVNSLRVLASAVQLILVGFLVMGYVKKGAGALGTAFLVSLPFLYFFTLYFSLSLSICFYLLAAILLLQQALHDKLIKTHHYGEFFLIAGAATAYFDFLTYPLVTLGFPIVTALYLEKCQWKKALSRLGGYSAEWGIGYLGLWAWKWIFTDVLTGGNVISDALSTLGTRIGTAESKSFLAGFLYVLQKNLSVYLNWPYALLCLGIAAGCFLLLWKNRSELKKEQWKTALVIGIVALFPFVWFLVTQNHSEQHWVFTNKIFSVSVFAAVSAVAKWTGTDKDRTFL